MDIATIYKIIDELKEIKEANVRYKENQLEMAHDVICKMQLGIERVLDRLEKYE